MKLKLKHLIKIVLKTTIMKTPTKELYLETTFNDKGEDCNLFVIAFNGEDVENFFSIKQAIEYYNTL